MPRKPLGSTSSNMDAPEAKRAKVEDSPAPMDGVDAKQQDDDKSEGE